MSVISTQYDSFHDHVSPALHDEIRVVKYDEKGNEVIFYAEPDYPSFTKSLGIAEDWSIESLMKAGINPEFPISTGNVTRLNGINDIQSVAVEVEQSFTKESKEK